MFYFPQIFGSRKIGNEHINVNWIHCTIKSNQIPKKIMKMKIKKHEHLCFSLEYESLFVIYSMSWFIIMILNMIINSLRFTLIEFNSLVLDKISYSYLSDFSKSKRRSWIKMSVENKIQALAQAFDMCFQAIGLINYFWIVFCQPIFANQLYLFYFNLLTAHT